MGKINSIEDLHVWQSARSLCLDVEKLVNSGALNKNQALKMQIQRSSISVVSNIAEGFGRGGNKEFINYLSIARGSLSEVLSQLILAHDFGYCPEHQYERMRGLIDSTWKLIGGTTRHLKNSDFTGSKFKQE